MQRLSQSNNTDCITELDDAKIGFEDHPAELRNAIYTLALVKDRPIGALWRGGSAVLREPPLLAVSQQVRSEAIEVFYGANTFILGDWDILTKMGSVRTAMLRSVQLSCAPIPKSSRMTSTTWLDYIRLRANKLAAKGSKRGLRSNAILVPVKREGSVGTHWKRLAEIEELEVVNVKGGWRVVWKDSV